jgi:hypothetical protein
MRKRTIKLYAITDNGRRIFASKIKAGSPVEVAAKWRAFLATASRGIYVSTYRGATLGLEVSAEAAHTRLAA